MSSQLDAGVGARYYLRLRERVRSTRVVTLVALSACARAMVPTPGPVDPTVEREVLERTALDGPLRVVFDWELREEGARFGGRGLARIEPPDRARLDLFGPRGEGLLTAALVGDELRLPAVGPELPVPPPPLLWSVLGVVRPPAGARLMRASREDARLVLEYDEPDGRWRFIVESGGLRRVERYAADGGEEVVELNGAGPYGVPERSVYRDLAAFRELIIAQDQVDEVEGFADAIWTPGAP